MESKISGDYVCIKDFGFYKACAIYKAECMEFEIDFNMHDTPPPVSSASYVHPDELKLYFRKL